MKAIFKSKLFVLISAFIMAICCVLGANALTAPQTANAETATQSAPTLTIESNNVSYADSVYILYAVSNDGFDRNQNEIKMLFWEDVQETYVVGTEKYAVTSSGTAKVKGKSCLIFYSDGLAAKEMTEDIYARAYVEIDGVAYYSETMKFSVLEYVYTQKEKGGLTTTQINLYTNLLNYGASAQYQFNYNIDRIANGDYFSITIINGKLPDGFAHGRYKNKDKIKIKADKAPKGMKFSHWEDENGIIISYDEHIEIELKGNKTYEAVYKDISSVATQLVLTAEVPYDGDTNDIELPTAVSIDVGGETVTLEVTWNTESFKTNTVGTQTLYATLVDQTAYDKYDIEVGGIMMNVTTLPYTYEIDTDTGEYILTGYYGTDTEITLPTSYKNTFITTIASKAFNKALTLTNVVIPNTYTKIEQTAFFLCDNIESITVPFVGETATSNNSWFGYIFGAGDYEAQYTMLPLAIKEVTIADGATSVPIYAFYNCSQIVNFNLSNTITAIQPKAFYGCTKLTEFTIPDTLTTFAYDVFTNSGLKRVNASSTDKVFSLTDSPFGSGADLYVKDQLITEISIPVGTGYLYSSFSYCTSIQKVVLPETLTDIGYDAFSHCINLTTVEMPSSLRSIKDRAFYQCSSLTSIEMPDSVTSIGNNAFYYCRSLTSVTIPDSVTSIGYDAFCRCTALTSAVIGNGITSIESLLFEGCSNLTNVVMGDNVNSIGDRAFDGCISLRNIKIPEGVTSIGECVFLGCKSLTRMIIPELVYDIGASTFSGCTNLTRIDILSKRLTEIGSNAFLNCTNLWEIYNLSDLEFTIGSDDFGGIAKYAKVIHTSLDEIAYTAVDKDGFITYTDGEEIILYGYAGNGGNVEIPEGVTAIYEKAFWSNQAITNVIIPDSVTSIGENAFSDCHSLTSVVIGDSVISIGEGAFSWCYKLVEVVNKSSHITVTKGGTDNGNVGYYALDVYNRNDAYTTKLSNDNGYIVYTDGAEKILVGYIGTETDLVLPSYITKIYQYAFYYCDSLTSVEIPDSVTSIGNYAFAYCDSLTSVVISDSVTSIGDRAFVNCRSLTSVVIGASVTSIGEQAFHYCDSLTSITFTGTVAQWNEITKGYGWKAYVPATKVVCKDGELAL